MAKGTPAHGKRNSKSHIMCRRCGNHSYNAAKKVCASCGFGDDSRRRRYFWAKQH